MKLNDFVRFAKNSKNEKEQFILQDLQKMLYKIDMIRYAEEGKDVEIERYTPAIFLVNPETADKSKTPILSFSVSFDNQETKEEDNILAWSVNDKGEFEEFFLSEKEAMSSTNPIYIIDNAEFDNVKELSNEKKVHNDVNTISKIESIQHHIISYRISEIHDNSNHAEYSYELAYRYNNGTHQLGGTRTSIARIHKNDIGHIFLSNQKIWELDYQANLSGFNMATFEYDWYASKKYVWTPGSIYLACRTKFSSHYYQRIYVPINEGLNLFIEKGHIQIHKK